MLQNILHHNKTGTSLKGINHQFYIQKEEIDKKN